MALFYLWSRPNSKLRETFWYPKIDEVVNPGESGASGTVLAVELDVFFNEERGESAWEHAVAPVVRTNSEINVMEPDRQDITAHFVPLPPN